MEILPEGCVVCLNQCDFVKVFRVIHSEREREYWATDIAAVIESGGKSLLDLCGDVEEYNEASNNFAVSKSAKAAKKWSNVDTPPLTLPFYVLNPIDQKPASAGTKRNGKSTCLPFPGLLHSRDFSTWYSPSLSICYAIFL
jgi:hypothetical protein